MFITDPEFYEFYPSRIPDTTTSIKEKGEKICCPTFFCSPKYHKIENYFIFKLVKMKNLSQSIKNNSFFTQKFVTKLSILWIWIRDPGSRGQKSTGSRIRIRDTDINYILIIQIFPLQKVEFKKPGIILC
jgi:hypothetical protein